MNIILLLFYSIIVAQTTMYAGIVLSCPTSHDATKTPSPKKTEIQTVTVGLFVENMHRQPTPKEIAQLKRVQEIVRSKLTTKMSDWTANLILSAAIQHVFKDQKPIHEFSYAEDRRSPSPISRRK